MKRLLASGFTVGVLTLGLPSAALAQYQLGNGRALDNNLRVGSGGRNDSQAPTNLGLYQDALITGNTGGLSRFRGNIGYRAVGEFSGNLPSNDNFRFYLNSLPAASTGGSTPAGQPLLPQANQQAIMFRTGAGATAGQITGQYTPYDSAGVPLYRNDVAGLNVSGATSGTGYGGAMPLNMAPLSQAPQQLAVGMDSSGTLLQITATPLTGLRTTQLGAAPLPKDFSNVKPTDANSPDQPTPGETPLPGTVPFPTQQLQPDGTPGPDSRVGNTLPPTLIISARLGGTPGSDDARLRSGDVRSDVLDQQLFHPEGWANAKPGQDVYADLLARASGVGAQQPPNPAQPGNPAQPPGTPPPDRLGTAVAPPKEPPKTRAEQIAEEFDKTKKAPEASPTAKPPTADQLNVDALVSKLSYNLPPLTTLVGAANSPFNTAMGDAEKSMAAGKYFDAEDSYLRAMNLQPNHPLAQIGRVHAQLGAGLYVSAGFNLRQILLNNPQIIAARFTGTVLPQISRMVRIDEDLANLQKRNPNEDVALVQAYLAYQRHQTDRVETALDIMVSRNPNDPLVAVVRRIWVGRAAKPTPADSKSDPKADSKTDPKAKPTPSR